MTELTLRPLNLTDFSAVNSLYDQVWWPTRSLAGWRWLIDGPPGVRPGGAAPVAGWVCEQDGEVVAHLGNIVQRFSWRGETLYGAVGHSLVSDPRSRGAARKMLRTFAGQPDVFSTYTFNANALSRAFYQHFSMTPWPLETHAVRYCWWTDPVGLVLERLAWKLTGSSGLEAARRRPDRFLRPCVDRPLALPPRVRRLAAPDIDQRFDALHAAVVADGACVAARDAATLRWRMSDPDNTRPPVLLAYEEGGGLVGYLLAQPGKQTQIDQTTLEIIDLFTEPGAAPRAVPALIHALTANAARLGAARVRLMTVAPALDAIVGATRGARRQITHGHSHVRLNRPEASLDWNPTPYDGDLGFVLRPPPVKGRVAPRPNARQVASTGRPQAEGA